MSAVSDHPVAIFGGLVGSPIGGALLAYITRTEICPVPALPTECYFELNPFAGVFATLVGWGVTGFYVWYAERQAKQV